MRNKKHHLSIIPRQTCLLTFTSRRGYVYCRMISLGRRPSVLLFCGERWHLRISAAHSRSKRRTTQHNTQHRTDLLLAQDVDELLPAVGRRHAWRRIPDVLHGVWWCEGERGANFGNAPNPAHLDALLDARVADDGEELVLGLAGAEEVLHVWRQDEGVKVLLGNAQRAVCRRVEWRVQRDLRGGESHHEWKERKGKERGWGEGVGKRGLT